MLPDYLVLPNETDIDMLTSNVSIVWGNTDLNQVFIENGTVITHYTGTVHTYSQVVGLDLLIQCAVVCTALLFLCLVMLGLLVWKMYFGSGEKE